MLDPNRLDTWCHGSSASRSVLSILNKLVLNLDRLLPHHSEPGCFFEASRRDRVFVSDHEASESQVPPRLPQRCQEYRTSATSNKRGDGSINARCRSTSVCSECSKLNLFCSDKKEPRTRVESK